MTTAILEPKTTVIDLIQLGGKHQPSDVIDDRNQTFMESLVSFERERWRAIEAERRGEPCNPF